MKNKYVLSKLESIRALLNNAQDIYNTIPLEEKEKIRLCHNDNTNLPYCLRWAVQASEELCEKHKDIAQAKEAQED